MKKKNGKGTTPVEEAGFDIKVDAEDIKNKQASTLVDKVETATVKIPVTTEFIDEATQEMPRPDIDKLASEAIKAVDALEELNSEGPPVKHFQHCDCGVCGIFPEATGEANPGQAAKFMADSVKEFEDAIPTLEYNILCEITHEALIVAVNAAIQDDWNPAGGVSSTIEYRYIQAVTRVVRA